MKFIEAKVVTLGQWGVGKSAVVQRYVKKSFEPAYRNTIGTCFLFCKLNIEDINLTLQIWDTSGEERYKAILPMYYRAGNAILLIFDLTSYESFTKTKTLISELNKYCENHVVLLLIGNKLDLIERREVSEKEAKEFASSIDVSYYEVSALTNYGIDDVFQKVASELVNLIKQGKKTSMNFYQCEKLVDRSQKQIIKVLSDSNQVNEKKRKKKCSCQ
ncbi:ras-related protein Rab-30-like [Leptopilina boulardi]|uniref:ras-related protein Rab-30-like n=1 Tax=Leptopilina boulardi TaxID=63433 RepID=UPI0021F69953|nr:ras-related protein Rab-30-like [Leptopilina boulardi]